MTARERSAYHHGDLPNALVREARALVEAHGVEAFSLREAAARCGVAVSAAYRHYPSRGALLAAVADLGFQALAERMEQRARRAAGGLAGVRRAEARLVEIGRSYVLFAIDHPNLFRLMYGPHGPKGGGADPRPDAPAHRLSAILVEALEDVMRAYGRAPTHVETHRVIAWALVHGFSMMVVDGVWAQTGKTTVEAMIAELGRAVLRSLR